LSLRYLVEDDVAAAADGDGEEAQDFIQDTTITALEEAMAGVTAVAMEEDVSAVVVVIMAAAAAEVVSAAVAVAVVAVVAVAVSNQP
jgi:hypothetical protein